MKKTFSIIAVFMAVLLFLTSCAKSVSKDEAVNFAKENYDYFYSIALDALADSVLRYDESKNCQFKTFLVGNIKRKFNT